MCMARTKKTATKGNPKTTDLIEAKPKQRTSFRVIARSFRFIEKSESENDMILKYTCVLQLRITKLFA